MREAGSLHLVSPHLENGGETTEALMKGVGSVGADKQSGKRKEQKLLEEVKMSKQKIQDLEKKIRKTREAL